jgi:hypothetical protein
MGDKRDEEVEKATLLRDGNWRKRRWMRNMAKVE